MESNGNLNSMEMTDRRSALIWTRRGQDLGMERLSSEGGARPWRGWARFHFEEQHEAGVTRVDTTEHTYNVGGCTT